MCHLLALEVRDFLDLAIFTSNDDQVEAVRSFVVSTDCKRNRTSHINCEISRPCGEERQMQATGPHRFDLS